MKSQGSLAANFLVFQKQMNDLFLTRSPVPYILSVAPQKCITILCKSIRAEKATGISEKIRPTLVELQEHELHF